MEPWVYSTSGTASPTSGPRETSTSSPPATWKRAPIASVVRCTRPAPSPVTKLVWLRSGASVGGSPT